MFFHCWKSFWELGNNNNNEDGKGKVKGLMWYKDLGEHVNGEYSMAVMRANEIIEDECQVEAGDFSSQIHGTFIGVYDGHGGPQAATFVNNNLFHYFKSYVEEEGEVTEEAIKKAFLATDEEFLNIVRKQWEEKPHIASQGSCCLVGVISNGHLFVANAGDSRVVLGRSSSPNSSSSSSSSKGHRAMQLSTDHNAKMETEREQLRCLHPHDPDIVVLKHKTWRVKGIIQVTRSIGDLYLKRPEFNREPVPSKYRVGEPFREAILRAEPSVSVMKLQSDDRFCIFASDGLWDHLTNQHAVNLVFNFPRYGIARRLVKEALRMAAKKREMRYSDLKKIDAGVRRHFHDDITCIVVFLDDLHLHKSSFVPFSIKGGGRLSQS